MAKETNDCRAWWAPLRFAMVRAVIMPILFGGLWLIAGCRGANTQSTITVIPGTPPARATRLGATPEAAKTPTLTDPRSQLAPGVYLVYWTDGSLRVMTMDGRIDTLFTTVVDDPDASSSPDGNKIAFSQKGQLVIYDLGSGQLTPLPDTGTESHGPKWSPDGSGLIYVFDSNPPVDPSIYWLPLATGRPVRLTPWDTVERAPAWSPDGKKIIFATDQAKIHLSSGSFLGATELYVMDAACVVESATCSEDIRQMTDMGTDGASDEPSWSPDGQSIAFSCGSNYSGRFQRDICIMDSNGTGLTKVTTTPEDEFLPAWSADGDYVAFTRRDSFTQLGDVLVYEVEQHKIVDITNTPDRDEAFVFWLVMP